MAIGHASCPGTVHGSQRAATGGHGNEGGLPPWATTVHLRNSAKSLPRSLTACPLALQARIPTPALTLSTVRHGDYFLQCYFI
jgi:hypothetical protein